MLNSVLQKQIENNSIFHSYILEGNSSNTREQYLEFSKKVLTNEHDINNLIQVIKPENNNISINLLLLYFSIFEYYKTISVPCA